MATTFTITALSSSLSLKPNTKQTKTHLSNTLTLDKKPFFNFSITRNHKKSLLVAGVGLFGSGCLALTLIGPSSAAQLVPLQLDEPVNALSLPTWAIHVSSVVEWITAMALVWQYGEKSGFESWKSLSWGMVPPFGGALCACTWHFFYDSESLEVLVAYQAALTVIGNATMCYAAYRIYKSSKDNFQNL